MNETDHLCSCSFGWENERRENFAFLDEDTLLTATGNLVILIDIRNQTQKYILSTSGIGVSAIAVLSFHFQHLTH